MLTIFIATLFFFLLAFIAMSLGYIIKRKEIQGSCGGLSNIGIEKVCDCPQPCDLRKKRMAMENRKKQQQMNDRII
ncbi:(Na+)-NQR maturation NqrM [Arsenophonus nasoniae]|uniref:(Na+)-NQR maturation NqrM n=1 Tax=Arsenophonus nasoniae TaxID=638 RepID=D2U052_9GAMM|nr:(Na+)-NQR maturation NqrM [Arsenophonus nasoniae]QBY42419.1 (Na+)-NQR maturation NqrM [Arsenophonus nasoniae]WGL94720.1 (Na+)-NQR maturation NqrM [Arsenophonus nasoniae]WGM02356.1 (Na+)-NQR maturation NqrM [Arsenophonus nasoniae]WGM06541.1 (Na+)-NQR maturation NqrM [Arsenophonus nasoniae]WGM11480.1 (Na+)-NQR maturation NqrM [Arsenophonus nasoniae]